MNQHVSDCAIFMSLVNDRPEAGICTCGYGWALRRTGDWSQVFSEERREKWNNTDEEEQRFGVFKKSEQKRELRRRLAYIFGPLFRQLKIRDSVTTTIPILVEIRKRIVEFAEVGIFSRRDNYLMHEAVNRHERRIVCYWGKFYDELYKKRTEGMDTTEFCDSLAKLPWNKQKEVLQQFCVNMMNHHEQSDREKLFSEMAKLVQSDKET